MKKSIRNKRIRSTVKFYDFALGLRPKLPIVTAVAFVLLMMIFQSLGCSVVGLLSGVDPELKRNLKLWRESKVVNYNFVMSRDGGGTLIWVPVFVKVRDAKAVSMEPTRERSPLDKIDDYENFDTVEKCFERIQESYDRGEKTKVIYNQELGYPEEITFDPKHGTIDTLYSIYISKFEVIKN